MTDKLEALKAKKPADTKTLAAEKAGYVTDDNSGGYYVVECQECGEVYPSQQSAGGGQIADTGDHDDSYCPHCGYVDPDECDNVGLVWNVQQAKINALLAALEEKDQQAETLKAELLAIDKDHALEQKDDAESRARQLNRAGQRVEKLQQLLRDAMAAEQSALRREEHLKATVDVLSAKNAELQQRLQQPIKLPESFYLGHSAENVKWMRAEHVKEAVRTAGYRAEDE